jgi:hypothetical protein
LDSSTILDVWNKNYMALYYLNRKDESVNIISDLKEKSATNDSLKSLIKQSQDYYKSNFSYLNNETINNWINNI